MSGRNYLLWIEILTKVRDLLLARKLQTEAVWELKNKKSANLFQPTISAGTQIVERK